MLTISETNNRKRSANYKAESIRQCRERKGCLIQQTLVQSMFLLLLFDLEKYGDLQVFLLFLLLNLLWVIIFNKI